MKDAYTYVVIRAIRDYGFNLQYHHHCEVIEKVLHYEIVKLGHDFKQNKIDPNLLLQGDFNQAYKHNTQIIGKQVSLHVSKTKAEKILHACFNWLISQQLMTFDYHKCEYPKYYIKQARYYYSFDQNDIQNGVTLHLYYTYQSRNTNHSFDMAYQVYDFKPNYLIQGPSDVKIPIDLLIKSFLPVDSSDQEFASTVDFFEN